MTFQLAAGREIIGYVYRYSIVRVFYVGLSHFKYHQLQLNYAHRAMSYVWRN
jgi:hypothetical protein